MSLLRYIPWVCGGLIFILAATAMHYNDPAYGSYCGASLTVLSGWALLAAGYVVVLGGF